MRNWKCYQYQRPMTKEEFLEVMKNINWENDSICSIFEEIEDAIQWYDDCLHDEYLSDFYNEEEAKEYAKSVMDNYGLYTVATLLANLKPDAGDVYIYRDGSMANATKDELKRMCDEIINIIKEKY